ncbi:hypothetical protein R6Q59_002478 [Mikania micrantha]|uniref:Uncharacterized protein n=1 Tax=Mikania micrantha TaxID=192012 RepID=A0A5N6NR65_9ASTR|nr:hypothetical protein E3N88_19514 [Mikania micrantha]
MDNNGLNINLPLLSVRRSSSISSSKKNENQKTGSYLTVRPSIESCKAGSTSNPMMNPGSVPFGWEHSPGRPKNERNKQIQSMENSPSLPKLPPGRFFKSRKMIKPECSKSTKKDTSGSRVYDVKYDDEDTHMDAVATVSLSESLHNCSASGIGSDVKPSGIHQAESKTRDFMLGRFLPAARAMASDAPQHTFKKLSIEDKPQEVKKLVNMDNNHDKEEEEDDYDSDYEYHEHGKQSSKFCGLIPRFCSANAVHGTSLSVKLPISPANKTQASSSSGSSFRETNSEPARSGVYKHRSVSSVLRSEFIEPANIEGSKLYSRLQGPAIGDLSGSIQSTLSEQSDSSSKKKGISFRELLADKSTNEITETDSQDSIFEKTLYVDTIHTSESPKENAASSCMKPQSSFNELLESEHEESKHDLKTSKCKNPDHDAELEWFDDDPKINLKLKAYYTKLFENPAPPPLPKSPSDSWLCRTLPSVSSKKVSAYWIPIYPSSNMVTDDPKTEENIQLESPQEQQRSPVPES